MVDLYELIYLTVFPAFAEIRFEAPTAKQAPEELEKSWIEAARVFVASRPVEARIKHVLDSTIAWVQGIVSEALAEGTPIREMAKEIVDKWTDPVSEINVNRAKRIARTEVISAANAGSHQGAGDTGVEMRHFWISTFDGRTRPAHDTRQHPSLAEPIPLEQSFFVDGESLRWPGDPSGSAGNVIQCRCVEGYEPVTEG